MFSDLSRCICTRWILERTFITFVWCHRRYHLDWEWSHTSLVSHHTSPKIMTTQTNIEFLMNQDLRKEQILQGCKSPLLVTCAYSTDHWKFCVDSFCLYHILTHTHANSIDLYTSFWDDQRRSLAKLLNTCQSTKVTITFFKPPVNLLKKKKKRRKKKTRGGGRSLWRDIGR